MKVQFTCLANSKRESERCIAGIRNDGGGWFRPISISGPLTRSDYLLEDGNIPELLDTIEVEVVEPKPELYQPENWILGSTTWKLVNKVDPSNAYNLFKDFVISESDLFGNKTDSIALSVIKDNPVQASLALIEPEDVSWYIKISQYGRRQTRALFTLEGANYDLSVTDPVWEARLKNLDFGVHPEEAAGINTDTMLLFTISLGSPYGGECYKLIAGILEIPNSFELINFLTEHRIEFIDKRSSGGALWLVGGEELTALVSELKGRGISFIYSPKGGKASGYRPAWYYKT